MKRRKAVLIAVVFAVLIVGCKKKQPPTAPGGTTTGTPGGSETMQTTPGTMVAVDDAEVYADANEQMPTKIGDKAWDLKTLDYVKGGPLMIEPGFVYVVEFWATSSEASSASIGLLTELALKYKNRKVAVVGVSKEDLGVVRGFVTDKGDKIGYDVAVDSEGSVYSSYMTAFEQEEVPYAFIVDSEGKIAWHGAPTADMGQELEKLAPEASEVLKDVPSEAPEAPNDVPPEASDPPEENAEE